MKLSLFPPSLFQGIRHDVIICDATLQRMTVTFCLSYIKMSTSEVRHGGDHLKDT